MKTHSYQAFRTAALPLALGLILVCAPAQRVEAQTTPTQPGTQTTVAALHPPVADGVAHDGSGSKPVSAAPAVAPYPDVPPAVARQLAALQAEIEELKAELKSRGAVEPAAPAPATPAAPVAVAATSAPPATFAPAATPAPAPEIRVAEASPSMAPIEKAVAQAGDSATAAPAKKEKIAPFSDWDWTWLNGNPRNKDTAFDSKFFTPEIRADVTYTYDFNKPVDNSMGGSSELFRSNEIQLEQLGIGGDFHLDNVRARFMTQFGMYSTATIRNDPSYSKGQWNIGDADRYLSEAYGGYHLDVLDGINIDAGIFMSYVGLFSYYNFDNWAYQPSYVSSNTPWFFEGIRIQVFPNPHLKIEPWIINGWQSYGSSNSRKGLGGQIKWTPKPWINFISNNYGIGHDDLYIPNRGRIHTDDSVEIKYYDKPGQFLDKMAFSFTGDMGCEYGPSTTSGLAGVSCYTNRRDPLAQPSANFPKGGVDPKQSFIGYMLYDRSWFKKDKYGLTIGGGKINNPGRYLVLLPPINGETASSAAINAPYFTGNPGDPFKAWDTSITYDYMPRQWLTFRWEYDYRHASVPYWSGKGGVTPPGSGGVPYTNNGSPQFFACNDGNTSGALTLAPAQAACAAQGSTVWFPDLRRNESLIDIDIMVKF
ncbi:MAG TPA: outer membrane beta-barrel protein [Candidatus Sulfotelmatobacter sp.]|nr:outer membrane beta-barrel protein [Candidatus Sulfotelmatobacter sp.]